MPEETSNETTLENLLENIDGYPLTVHNYTFIQNALNTEYNIPLHVVEKLLSICTRNLRDDMKNPLCLLNILSSVLKKIKIMQFTPLPDLVPSAIAVLHTLETTVVFIKVEALQALCFEIIMSYPDKTLIDLSVNHCTELLDFFNLYCHQRIPVEIRIQPINIIIKLLKILPPDKKRVFVKKGINIWFSHLIPMINVTSALPQVLQALELLTDDLLHIDYADTFQWRLVLESIYTPKKYPALMKNLLETGIDNWYRLWIVFIRLLKNQITKSVNAVGSPINSMLPVVELAFKMDVTNRCRAFSCWNVLIDNFSTETNEVYINKRIKLLIIPLTSNNAKVEKTAIAKLNTWWHLISCFYPRMDKFSEIILIPFLHFCFGKSTPDKPIAIPGMISETTKVQVVQAFINIMGHVHCEGCVTLPKLKGKLISTKLLVSHWRDWINALNTVIHICAENHEFSVQNIKCLWISFIITVGELPENNIRRDLFNEVLNLLENLTEGCNDKLAEIILNVLILNLFDKDDKIKPLLKSKDEQNAPIDKIITIILKLPLCNLENREMVVQNFQMLSSFLIEEAFKLSSNIIEDILKYLPQNGLLLWVSLADTISESLYVSCPHMLCKMAIWPFNIMDVFVNDKLATLTWLKLYKSIYRAIHMTTINEDIIEALDTYETTSLNTFVLNAAVTILHKTIELDDGSIFVKEAIFLLKTLSKINKFSDVISTYPLLIEVVVQMLNSLCKNTNIKAAKSAVSIISNILKLFTQSSKDLVDEADVLKYLESVFKALESVLKVNEYSKLKWLLLDQLKNCAPYLKNQQNLKEIVLAIYKGTNNEDNNDFSVKEVIEAFETEDNSNMITESVFLNQCSDKANFTTPSGKSGTKKMKNKETNIVNTVMENGEEFVVVKSNWKFNPRKLTDNQKEKLQRKREDIPALYQDLSQSQDEFKLTTWKTDSQDTTTTTSKSTDEPGNNDVSSILKNIPSSDFVPKILENIMAKDKVENEQKTTPAKENTKIDVNEEENNKQETNKLQITLNETKSQRLALKDRVFRNVRNLIEKSNLSNDSNEVNSSLAENPKTPLTKVKPPVINSAPTLICADRPSRLKRKPKKFEDLEVFGLKKRFCSPSPNNSPTDGAVGEINVPQTNIFNDHTKEQELPLENEENIKGINNLEIKNIHKESTTSVIEVKSYPIQKILDNTGKSDNFNVQDKNKCTDDNPVALDNKTNDEKTQSDEKTDNGEKLILLNEKIIETSCDDDNQNINLSNSITPCKKTDVQKSTKKSSSKKSRIEKELAIDMVEGHPFLMVQSEKRLTRKGILNSPCTRQSLSEKNKTKIESKNSKTEKKVKEKERSISIKETQITNNDDMLASQDVIESSQESTLTTISVKSSKSVGKKSCLEGKNDNVEETQSFLKEIPNDNTTSNISKDDTELPLNKTVDENVLIDLTENMDIETINIDEDVIIINDDDDKPVLININDKIVDQNTQNTAEADTQSLDPSIFTNEEKSKPIECILDNALESNTLNENSIENTIDNDITNASLTATHNDETKTMSESVLGIVEKEDLNSPFKDEERRKNDFLNNTLEISPIKTLSPVREKKSSSPETSSDYVVIKLSSPVQSNGEPFEKIESPEIFTEEKMSPDKRNQSLDKKDQSPDTRDQSPDKRDQSPPREEVSVTNTSPSSCLSLKKNRPQVRSGGRAAQMLGLCVPDRLQTILMSEKASDVDENKKSPSLNTSARRNLRILYNTSTGETHDNSDEQEDSDNFLKLKRNLPATDCSPSGPILKRKLADITDEATASPASKRKRVSFHDPPVSTTICVKKYIDPCGVRSPQNSAIKRQERHLRSQLATKSPKRLENVFKLDSVLTKAVESFNETNVTADTYEDSEISSIEQTPIVEVTKTTDLNHTDPICIELVDCKDPISNIACELSSPAMKTLLIEKLGEEIGTVGDLAKLTELEINRLCIKAPKVQVAKKVLNKYLKIIQKVDEEITSTGEVALNNESIVTESKLSVGVQTDEIVVENNGMQTNELVLSTDSTQTDSISIIHCSAQTDESGSKTMAEIVTCLSEKNDFIANLCEKMDESSKKQIVDNLSFDTLTEMFVNKLTKSNSDYVLNKVIEQTSKLDTSSEDNKDKRLSTVQDYLCERFESKDLILFCSGLLRKMYEKS